jgi:hypothetical protein
MTEHTPPVRSAGSAPAGAGAPRPLLKRPLFWLIVIGVLLLAAVAVLVGIAIGGMAGAGTAGPASQSASPGSTATAPASEAPATPTETPAAIAVPGECADIYTRDWDTELGGLALNPEWTETPGNGPFWGSNDDGAITVLEATSTLTCAWVSPNGGGDVGIITNISSLTPEQQVSVTEHLGASGFACYEELSGTRCVIEWSSDAGESGESHFLREGIWSATRWSNVGADGYTHDIVTAIFG